ncbi:FkbM family methyltransferase [Haloarcula sp. Atlit-120R]|uniref:FkbM family methyltransferase n=1 Tax=Haloarcula sp. Atlit-120R TaxID=2282135 RepID=UPI000EF1A5B8|nr:FkbM family methyltransferase [Haloarcula sp. Atlit-120R]RLM39382.1 FkbM family methyltransferase [Haloarcula sp. Atlit-120R]
MNTIKNKIAQAYQIMSGHAVEKFLNPVDYNGVKINTNCGAVQTKNKARFFPYYFRNEHSIREKNLIDAYLPENYPIIEFGAGIGYISAYIDSKVRDDERQIAVEPNPENVNCNKMTKQLNQSDYILLEGAYSANDDDVKLSLDNKFSSGSTEKEMSGRQISVEGFSISSICAEYELDDFVLISDMEGGEFRMIEEELNIISDFVPFAIIEFHPFDEFSEREYVDKMVSAGFVELDEMGGTYAFKNKSLI